MGRIRTLYGFKVRQFFGPLRHSLAAVALIVVLALFTVPGLFVVGLVLFAVVAIPNSVNWNAKASEDNHWTVHVMFAHAGNNRDAVAVEVVPHRYCHAENSSTVILALDQHLLRSQPLPGSCPDDRVFAAERPDIKLVVINANEQVMGMIRRAEAAAREQRGPESR